jgi:hypothetical protein
MTLINTPLRIPQSVWNDQAALIEFIDNHIAAALVSAMIPENDLIDEYILYGSVAFAAKYGQRIADRIAEYLR